MSAMRSFSLFHPRDQIVSIMERIYSHEMTTTSGGNISARDENGDVWITPARMDKGSLRRQVINASLDYNPRDYELSEIPLRKLFVGRRGRLHARPGWQTRLPL